MASLLENDTFRADYEKLRHVQLNPARHSASNAYDHCEMVRARARRLAELNQCASDDMAILDNLALVHDIGKIEGTTSPTKSVELLQRYGTFDELLVALVKYHDVNLSWYNAMRKGDPPSDKAWNRLVRRLDLRLLCLFMVADRVDCPGGWRANKPLIWFLDECRRRTILTEKLFLDSGPPVPSADAVVLQQSAGGVLLRKCSQEWQALVIRVRTSGYELPKGRIECGESPRHAALREVKEETQVMSPLEVKKEIGRVSYEFECGDAQIHKTVTYFLIVPATDEFPYFGARPNRTREIKWITECDLKDILLVNEQLRDLIQEAFMAVDAQP